MFSLSKVIRINKAILGLLRFEFDVFLTGSCFEYLVHSWWYSFGQKLHDVGLLWQRWVTEDGPLKVILGACFLFFTSWSPVMWTASTTPFHCLDLNCSITPSLPWCTKTLWNCEPKQIFPSFIFFSCQVLYYMNTEVIQGQSPDRKAIWRLSPEYSMDWTQKLEKGKGVS